MGVDDFGASGAANDFGDAGGDEGGAGLFESGGLFDEPAPAIDASSTAAKKTPTRPVLISIVLNLFGPFFGLFLGPFSVPFSAFFRALF